MTPPNHEEISAEEREAMAHHAKRRIWQERSDAARQARRQALEEAAALAEKSTDPAWAIRALIHQTQKEG